MAVRRSGLQRALALMLAAAVAGCGHAPQADKGLDCFPAEAARWIHVVEPESGKTGAQPASGSATIYVDRSGSMSGYVKGANRGVDSPFQDLIDSLPGMLKQMNIDARYKAFGLNIVDVGNDAVATLQSPSFYSCALAQRTQCENNESRINEILQRISAAPNEMGVVVTDLWFTDSKVNSSGLTVMQPVLTDILASGRTISIYGIDSPFDGNIYDLPVVNPGDPRSVPYKGRHPLYLLVVGSKAQALAFEQALPRSGSGIVARAMEEGRIPHSLFTVDPGPLKPRSKAPLERGNDPRMQEAAFEPMQRVLVQQFRLSGRLPPRGSPARRDPSWTAPAPDAFITNAVWRGPLAPTLRVWRRADTKCTRSSWNAPVALEGGWTDVPGTEQKRLTLDPARLAARLGRGGVYLLSGELVRQSVTSPNPATAWMTDPRWNLTVGAAAATARAKPATFPTLNLSELARIMEGSLAFAAERNGGGILGFSVLVELQE
jgi:hypothetical protein